MTSRHAGRSLAATRVGGGSGASRFVARTGATVSASAPPIGRRRLCAPRPPAWPIVPGSIRARDETRESAQRSPLARSPTSAVLVGPPAEPVGHSRRGETAWRPRAWHARGAVERSSGCHRSPVAARRRCCTNRQWPARGQSTGSSPADAIRHWSAEGGHPIEDLTAENGLTPLPSWTPGAKAIADDGLVAEERILHPALTMVP